MFLKKITCCPCVYSTPATKHVAAETNLSKLCVVESSSSKISCSSGISGVAELLPSAAVITDSGTEKNTNNKISLNGINYSTVEEINDQWFAKYSAYST